MSLLPDLRERLDEAAARHGIPGAAVAVGQGDELAEAATGVVNRDTGVTTTPDTLFQIGSVTKVWTAALVHQLVDEGLIDLDRPVRHYLPGFAVVDPAATETVTVRQLLLHVGGFEGDLFEDTGRGDDALDKYLVFLGGHAQQVFPPGAAYSYSNAGYAVLGALAARLRGAATWESVVRERLITPLGARHTALLAEEAILFRAAAGHGGDDATVMPVWQLPRSLAPAGATMCAAPRDLVRLGRAFFDSSGPLSDATITAMTTHQLTLPGLPERGSAGRALGPELFDWQGTAAFGHNGDTIGQGTQWRVVPSHGLVIAMSANHQAYTAFFDELLDGIVHDLTGLTVPPRPTPPAAPSRPGPPEYAGHYAIPLGTYAVTPTPTGLDVTVTPAPIGGRPGGPATTAAYVHLTGTTFIATDPDHGIHDTVTFVDGGHYLFSGRMAPRTT